MIRLLLSLSLLSLSFWLKAADWVEYVDTRVGTAASQTLTKGLFGKNTEEFGQTLPAVLTPWGMNFWTPQTRDTEHKCVAPYYYAESLLMGIRNSHWIVGGCTQDYGSMTLMPLTGSLRCSPQARASRFNHIDEVARPDYYSVFLPDEDIHLELTGTSRASIMRIVCHSGDKAYLVVNPNSDEGQGFIAVDTVRNMIYGYNPVHRIYQGKGQEAGFSGHFVVTFDHPVRSFGCFEGDKAISGMTHISKAPGIGCYVEFDVTPGDTLLVKGASSFTGHEGAIANLETEIPCWDFDKVRTDLHDLWCEHLGTVEVVSDDPVALRKFYGALYRASFLPHEVNDADGSYCAFAGGYPVMELPQGETSYYDDFSMWDTYRALHPFVNLVYPEVGGAMMQSLVHKYEQGGWLPIFPCWGSYTAAMIGDHCIAAIADAYVKGIKGFDAERAYEAMRHNAFDYPSEYEYLDGKGRRALSSYLRYGYVPVDDEVPDAYHKQEQVSRTLEYCLDDYALAQMALGLGHKADYETLMTRSQGYRYVINPSTGYADGRYSDGRWASDDPFAFTKHITEGAPCHYTWYVPHDPYGLMEMMGGRDAYIAKLDSMFSERRYWHGNEPCHQVAYMYNYANAMDHTSRAVRHIMETEYLDGPGGLAGNDDAGQMSAWYLFAALGFYPVCPATDEYQISGPSFKEAIIHLSNGNDLVLKAPNASAQNIYVRSITRNGEPYPYNYLKHSDLMSGGTYIFEMVNEGELAAPTN